MLTSKVNLSSFPRGAENQGKGKESHLDLFPDSHFDHLDLLYSVHTGGFPCGLAGKESACNIHTGRVLTFLVVHIAFT